jgi:hypothetical protein
MDETKREWVRSWLVKAHSDLRFARALVSLIEPATDTAIYHCQQAAEKSLKGYLAFRDQPLETQADMLNPYATAFRYPDTLGVQFPSVAEVNNAIEHAQVICDFVLGLIPEEARPK